MTNEEINKAIAEKVTGFRPKYEGEYPPYSTNIQDSWLVVEKMREKGFDFEFIWLKDTSAQAEFSKRIDDSWEFFKGTLETPSMTICSAALKAIS